ncbi:MAG: hypothetical protein LBH58_00065 [Tannerellaceae bacterium]|jgi:hypothetical protein|nr:hypothetical protein [Tannerellaceae bacterium]
MKNIRKFNRCLLKKHIWFLSFLFLLSTGCTHENEVNNNITISDIHQLNSELFANERAGAFALTTKAPWTINISEESNNNKPDWIDVNLYDGEAGTFTIFVSFNKNYTRERRNAIITISCAGEKVEIPIIQLATKADGKILESENDFASRTILLYVIASNLDPYITKNVEDMISSATFQNLDNGKLVVFYSKNKNEAELFEIKPGMEKGIRENVRNYTGKSAISPQTMKEILNEVVSLYPADSYGMILSSHGSAWMPNDFRDMLRSFGEEDRKSMEIGELAGALPNHFFNFLLFDACSMGSIEVIYELRNTADYIISSASEIMGSGFPYKAVLPYLFQPTVDLKKIVDDFHNYYSHYVHPFGNLSVVETSKLERVAQTTKEIISSAGSEQAMYNLPFSDLQILTYLSRSPSELFDFGNVMEHLATPVQKSELQSALDKAIIYKSTTERIYCQATGGNEGIPVKTYSGLSVYPPRKELTELNNWYRQLDWYKAVYE